MITAESVLIVNMQKCNQCGRSFRDDIDTPDDEKKICPTCKRLIELGLEEEL